MTQNQSFIHCFEPANRLEAPPLLLLHGTGGDENDLLPLGRAVSPGSALLSVRGKVLEHGMPRFFLRLAEGVFDEDDVVRRANELADFVEDARKQYDIGAPIALGYSNGANIAAAMLLLRPNVLAGGFLIRAMVPLSRPPKADLSGKPVLILSGLRDSIIPADNGEALAAMLRNAGADVDRRVVPVGHELSQSDLVLAREWMAARSVPATHDA